MVGKIALSFEGPIGTTNLIVPVASSQTSISAEAAHFVFGFGNESAVEPWTDDNFIIIRNQNSAVHNCVAAAIDVPATAFDKINVRRGQYYLWGTAHLFAKVSGSESKVADIADASVEKLIGWLTFTEDAPAELPVLDLYIDNYNVPQCAMQVRRSADLGPIESFQPEEPCGCYFDFRATGRTSCEECTTSADCPDVDNGEPICVLGYCEVHWS